MQTSEDIENAEFVHKYRHVMALKEEKPVQAFFCVLYPTYAMYICVMYISLE